MNFFGLSITNATLTLSNRNVDENTPAGLQIRSEWLGIFALKFHAIEKQNTFALGGTTDIKEIELPAIIIPKVVEPNTHIQLLPEIKLDAGLKAKVGISIEMGDRPQFFSAGVAITFSWHKFNLNLNLTTDEAFASLERLIQFIAEEISKGLRNVYKAFSTIFEDIGRWLAAAAKWVDNAWKKLGDLINRAGEAGEEFLNNMVKWNEDFLNFTVNMAERAWDSIERFAGRAGEFIGETFEKVFGGLSKIGSAIGLGAIGGGLSVNFSPPFGYKAPGLALINQELHFDGWRLDSCWMALKKWPREAIDVLVYFGKNDDKAEEYKAFWETTVLFEDHHWNTSTEYTIDDWEALGKLPVFAWEAIRKTVRFPGRGFGIADAWKIMVGKWVSLAKWLDQTAWQAVMRFRDFVWEAVARFSAEDWLATSELPTIAWQNISDSLDPSNADSIGWNMPEAWQTTIGQWQNLQQLSNPKAWQTTIRFRSFIWNLLPALHTGDDGNDWKAISRLKDFVWDALFENLAPDHSANGWNLQAAWQATIGKWQYVETWSQHGIMQSLLGMLSVGRQYKHSHQQH